LSNKLPEPENEVFVFADAARSYSCTWMYFAKGPFTLKA